MLEFSIVYLLYVCLGVAWGHDGKFFRHTQVRIAGSRSTCDSPAHFASDSPAAVTLVCPMCANKRRFRVQGLGCYSLVQSRTRSQILNPNP